METFNELFAKYYQSYSIPTSRKNCIVDEKNGVEFLFSYEKPVAMKKGDEIYINNKYYKYSATTSKHLGDFLVHSAKEIASFIKDGSIKLI